MSQRILITGGAGFIGLNFVEYWLQNHPDDQLFVVDKLTYSSHPLPLKKQLENGHHHFIQADISHQPLMEQLIAGNKIKRIIHFAAESHVDRSINSPQPFVDSNINGTFALLEALRTVWGDSLQKCYFHHISTDEVYGSLTLEDAPFTEDSPYRPNSPYSASKAASDHLVRAYRQTYGLNTIISHCSNNYGPYQHTEKLIPQTIKHILFNKPIPIYGDGQNIRDWLSVYDHCHAIDLMVNLGQAGHCYNVGGGVEINNINLAKQLCELTDQLLLSEPDLEYAFPDAPAYHNHSSKRLITFVADRKGHDFRYAINCDKIRADLGYLPQQSFQSALQDTIRWYTNYWSER